MNERKFHQQLDTLNENLSRIAAALERMSSNTNSTEDSGYDDCTEEDYRTSGEETLETYRIEIAPRFYKLYFESIKEANDAINMIHNYCVSDRYKYMSLYAICRVVYGKTAPDWTKCVTWYAGDLLDDILVIDIYENTIVNKVTLRFDRQECVEDIQKNL